MRGVSRWGVIDERVQVAALLPLLPSSRRPLTARWTTVFSGLRIIYINTCRKKKKPEVTVTADCFFPFHRAGYCNSTALVGAKPRARTLCYMSFPPSTFLLLSRKGSVGGSITQYYALRNVFSHSVVFEQKWLARNTEREMCSYPRTAQHHAIFRCPFHCPLLLAYPLHPFPRFSLLFNNLFIRLFFPESLFRRSSITLEIFDDSVKTISMRGANKIKLFRSDRIGE